MTKTKTIEVLVGECICGQGGAGSAAKLADVPRFIAVAHPRSASIHNLTFLSIFFSKTTLEGYCQLYWHKTHAQLGKFDPKNVDKGIILREDLVTVMMMLGWGTGCGQSVFPLH